MKTLVPRISGSKLAHLKLWKRILDAPYTVCYEPFAGGLAVSNYLNQKDATLEKIVCAEIDPSLVGLFQIWNDPNTHVKFLAQFNDWQTYPVRDVLRRLKRTYEQAWVDINPRYIDAAVAGLLLRYVAHNGKLAPNAKSNRLNITLSDQQINKWGKFKYEFPKAPKSFTLECDYNNIPWSYHDEPSIAVIDPPYLGTIGHVKYRDPDFIRPVYFQHKPHTRETLNMSTSPVAHAFSVDTTVVIACNYYTDMLSTQYDLLADQYGYKCIRFDGVPPKYNNGRKVKTPYYKDTYWVFYKPNDEKLNEAVET